jgi:carboxymethylenebutenolidase
MASSRAWLFSRHKGVFMSDIVPFQRPDGQHLSGYLVWPDGTPSVGVVVIQEWWGLNDQIRGVAQRMAAAGYVALVPDLYRGRSTVEAEEASHLMHGLNFGDAATQDVRGAVQYLKSQGVQKVAIMGFCMGGALTLLALGAVPEADAGVVWYGFPPLEYVAEEQIQVPVLAHWATQDQFFDIATVDALEQKLDAGGVDYTFHRYLAHHAFANETAVGPRRLPATQFDPVWAQTAWDRTWRFLGRVLG